MGKIYFHFAGIYACIYGRITIFKIELESKNILVVRKGFENVVRIDDWYCTMDSR
jgi:hypothetical protein